MDKITADSQSVMVKQTERRIDLDNIERENMMFIKTAIDNEHQ